MNSMHHACRLIALTYESHGWFLITQGSVKHLRKNTNDIKDERCFDGSVIIINFKVHDRIDYVKREK